MGARRGEWAGSVREVEAKPGSGRAARPGSARSCTPVHLDRCWSQAKGRLLGSHCPGGGQHGRASTVVVAQARCEAGKAPRAPAVPHLHKALPTPGQAETMPTTVQMQGSPQLGYPVQHHPVAIREEEQP